MTEKKTSLKTKIHNFVEKNQELIYIGAVTVVSYAAGIAVANATHKMHDTLEWKIAETDPFFDDADLITKSREGMFYKFTKINKETAEYA